MSDIVEVLNGAAISNATAPGLLHSLSSAAASAGAGSSHLTGLAQLAVLALLAFPIWLFGLLIGILLPKGTFSVSDSQSADDSADVISSTSSRASDVAGISSRPLSDEDLSDSESESGEDVDNQAYEDVAPSSTSKYDITRPGLSSIAVKPASSLSAAGKMMSAAAGKASHTVAWAQQLVGQQHQGHKYVSPSGPSTPDASYSSRVDIKSPDIPAAQHHHGHKHHHHHHQQQQSVISEQQAAAAPGRALRHFGSGSSGRSRSLSGPAHWFVTEDDLDKFHETVQPVQDKLLTGNIGPEWNLIMDKEVPGVVRYLSYWRPTDNGTTDYLSVTIIPDATAQEIHEFNLDDACRVSWDPMLSQTWLLSSRDTSAAEQLVVWLRSFPMGFLSDRLYSGIARRTFPDTERPGSSVYGVTKVIKTPASTAWAAEHYPGVIQTDNYYSAWRCRTIPSPWETETPKAGGNNGYGSDGMPQLTIKTNPEAQSTAAHSTGSSKPACELILLHHDELKVPEYLSRLAIKVGMWKFVTGMVDAAGTWLEERRARCDPFRDDPQAACRRQAPPLIGAAAAAATAAVPESPFSPLARKAPVGGFDRVDAADALLSPRRLYAVPTAPDLMSLSVTVEGEEDSSDSLAVPAAAAAAGSLTEGSLARKSPGLRRGHSLEWEPKPDADTGVFGSGRSTAVADGTFADGVATAAAEVTLQQRRFALGPVQLSLQPLRAVAGVPAAVQSAVQSAVSRLPAAARDMFNRLRRAEAPTAANTTASTARVAAESQPLPGKVPGGTVGTPCEAPQRDAGGAGAAAGDGDDDVAKSLGRDQNKPATQQPRTGGLAACRSVRKLRTSEPGKAATVRRVVVGGVLVYAAVGIIKLLAGGGQQEHASNRHKRGSRKQSA